MKPCFANEKKHEIEIGGRRFRFYPLSGLATLRLQAVTGPLPPELAAYMIIDSLRDEPGLVRPATPEACEQFLLAIDGPALTAMLEAVGVVQGGGKDPVPFTPGPTPGPSIPTS